MKRSAALAPLSRDHQEAAARFLAFFEAEGRRHFCIEEELVLTALSAHDPEWAECVQRVRRDHQAIRTGAREMVALDLDRPAEAVAAAQALGECLRDHVRFEERVLFSILERRLDPAELELLGSAIHAAETTDR